MRKLFSSFKTPCTVTINLDSSEVLDKWEQDQLAQKSQEKEEVDFQQLVTSETRPKVIQRTITVTDPHYQLTGFSQDESNGPSTTQPFLKFEKDDPIKGAVVITPSSGNTQHQGVRIELIGEIITYFDSKTHKFCNLSKELAGPGVITKEVTYPFEFRNVMKEYESYRGINCDLRYYLRVTITRSVFSIVKEQEFWVQAAQLTCPNKQPTDPGINMEVGLEGIVLLSIKYDKMYHEIGHGCIHGHLKFYLVNVKIDKAEVSLIKKEKAWNGDQEIVEQETLKKFEIIDGTPAKDEVVPVRIYLSAIDAWKLTPTIPDDSPVEQKFSVQYFIYLALCDTKGRRFFKQREIVLWRKHL
jgi:vacuolar protein sorting-associated protein 26